jgi:hypothetical protein
MEDAERGESWLWWCRDHDLYVACTEELVQALAAILHCFSGTVLAIGAGSGELEFELAKRAVPIIATDPAPPPRSNALPLNARDALDFYKPQTVLSSFLPVDAGIEAQILRCTSVRRYLYIGPKIMNRVGPESLWSTPGWIASPLPEIDSCLISRLDVLPDFTRRTHIRGAGAVLLQREN